MFYTCYIFSSLPQCEKKEVTFLEFISDGIRFINAIKKVSGSDDADNIPST